MRKRSNHRGHRGTRGTTQGTPDSKRALSATGKLAEDIRRRFAVFGGFDFESLQRDAVRGSQDFGRDQPR
jgi:hypothetical protein